VVGRDGISEDEANAWEAEQRELAQRGEFFFACIQFCFTATRPANNTERPHRALKLQPTATSEPPPTATIGEIERRDRLGGLIHEYHRTAA
jgi:hypothetical protein